MVTDGNAKLKMPSLFIILLRAFFSEVETAARRGLWHPDHALDHIAFMQPSVSLVYIQTSCVKYESSSIITILN